jgi:branched-subunit amino acid aminotransferase/4-amino-4-deoxychorismate lyase
MVALRWSEEDRAWHPVEGEAPEGFDGAEVGLYETLMASASKYARGLHASRIARSWERLTGRPFEAEALPSLEDACAAARDQDWPGLRFEVRRFPDGRALAQIRRRDRLRMESPVRLLPVALEGPDAAYPHKSVDRRHLTRAHQRAVAAGADDALFIVDGEVRETAQAFVGLVTAEALVLPPLREDVLPSTTRTAAAEWCLDNGRAVIERPIGSTDVASGTLIYGNALLGLLPAFAVGHAAVALPAWFDIHAIERRLAG